MRGLTREKFGELNQFFYDQGVFDYNILLYEQGQLHHALQLCARVRDILLLFEKQQEIKCFLDHLVEQMRIFWGRLI